MIAASRKRAEWTLDEDAIHVWTARVSQPQELVLEYGHLLAADERARAERFVYARDRDRFIVGRGVLRTVLSSYLDCPPGRLEFSYSTYGKPTLMGDHRHSVGFNVAHSGELLVIAVTPCHAVGVDVERLRTLKSLDGMMAHVCSPREIALLTTLPPIERNVAFLRCWTRKEALLKANGTGLSFPAQEVDTSGLPIDLFATGSLPIETPASTWAVADLSPGFGYVGALAVAPGDWRLTCRDLDVVSLIN